MHTSTCDNTGAGADYSIVNASTGNNYTSGSESGTVLERVSGGSETDGVVHIAEGDTARLRLTVYEDPATTASYRLQLNSVGFADNASDAGDDDVTASVVTPSEDFRTPSVLISN